MKWLESKASSPEAGISPSQLWSRLCLPPSPPRESNINIAGFWRLRMTSSQSPLKKEEMQFCRSEWKGQGLDPSGLHGISCTSLGLILWLEVGIYKWLTLGLPCKLRVRASFQPQGLGAREVAALDLKKKKKLERCHEQEKEGMLGNKVVNVHTRQWK